MPSRLDARKQSEVYRYAGLGLQFAATIGLFGFAGHWVYGRVGTHPWLLILGVFLGFAAGLYYLTRKLPASRRGTGERSDASERNSR